MSQFELIALDVINTDPDGRYILRAPGAPDSYIANSSVHFGQNFTVASNTVIASLNAFYLQGKVPADFATQEQGTKADTAMQQSDIDAITPGLDGKDGQIRFTGVGPPGVIIGASPNDEYLDKSTGKIYTLT